MAPLKYYYIDKNKILSVYYVKNFLAPFPGLSLSLSAISLKRAEPNIV